jgi:hypothetical protein
MRELVWKVHELGLFKCPGPHAWAPIGFFFLPFYIWVKKIDTKIVEPI